MDVLTLAPGVAEPDVSAAVVVVTAGRGFVVVVDAACCSKSPPVALVVVAETTALSVVWGESSIGVEELEAPGADVALDSLAESSALSTAIVITRLRPVPVGSHEATSPGSVWNDSNSGFGTTFDHGTLTADSNVRGPDPAPAETTMKYSRDAARIGDEATDNERFPSYPGATASEPSWAINGPGMPLTAECRDTTASRGVVWSAPRDSRNSTRAMRVDLLLDVNLCATTSVVTSRSTRSGPDRSS